MRRMMALLLCLLAMAGGAWADAGTETDADAPVVYWGMAYSTVFIDGDAPRYFPLADEETMDRVLMIMAWPYATEWFIMPEEAMPLEQYHGKGLRFTMAGEVTEEEKVPDAWVRNRVLTVEAVYESVYARILEIGKDYVKLAPIYEDAEYPERLTLTPESVTEHMDMHVGRTGEFFYDENGVVVFAGAAAG